MTRGKAIRGLLLFGLGLTTASSAEAAPAKKGAKNDPVKRGAYLVTVIGCNDCHTPMKMTPTGPTFDMEKMLSGRQEGVPDPTGALGKTDMALAGPDLTAFKMPFGTVYARNLTPDKTGLGEWTEAQFIKTLRVGRHQGDGRPLLPPMPWPGLSQLTDEDAKAIWAFLRTVKPIKNTVAEPKVPPPVLEQFSKANAGIVEAMKAGTGH